MGTEFKALVTRAKENRDKLDELVKFQEKIEADLLEFKRSGATKGKKKTPKKKKRGVWDELFGEKDEPEEPEEDEEDEEDEEEEPES